MTKRHPMARGQSRPRLNSILFAMIVEELVAGPSTWTDLAEKTGLCRGSVLAIVRALRARNLVHIAGWERDAAGRVNVPAFGFGAAPDAKKPVKSRNEINRDWRARQSSAPVRGTPFQGIGA